MTINLTTIKSKLAERPPRLDTNGLKSPAAVALILRQGSTDAGLEMLFIERSRHPRDPWSGNLAFPGGRVDPGDNGTRAAAERETLEELGLDLNTGEHLGQLDDITGAYLPVRISCHLYHLPLLPQLKANHEVTRWFWFPLDELTNPTRHTCSELYWQGENRTISGINLLGEGEPLLWGITYRLVMQFLAKLGRVDATLLQVIDD